MKIKVRRVLQILLLKGLLSCLASLLTRNQMRTFSGCEKMAIKLNKFRDTGAAPEEDVRNRSVYKEI